MSAPPVSGSGSRGVQQDRPVPVPGSPARPGASNFFELYYRALRAVVKALAHIAGASLMVMVLVTAADVLLRACGRSMTGAYDVVKIAAAIAMAAALPYTTAIKGHVAIEYFFHKLGRRGRIVVDALMRVAGMSLFGLLAWGCVGYGNSLRQKGEVSMTLQLPIFWVPYVLAGSCVLVMLIKIYHLTHPGKPMLKP